MTTRNEAVLNITAGMVRDFNHAFGVKGDRDLQFKLIGEESDELFEAGQAPLTPENTAHMLKEIADLFYVVSGLQVILEDDPSQDMMLSPAALEAAHKSLLMAEFIDETISLIPEAMQEDFLLKCIGKVHTSNMSKLGADGKPVYRDDGKILKGPNYKEADLSEEGDILYLLIGINMMQAA